MTAKSPKELISLVIGNIASNSLAERLVAKYIGQINESIDLINVTAKNKLKKQKIFVEIDPVLAIITSDGSSEAKQVDYDIDPENLIQSISALARKLAKEQQVVSAAAVCTNDDDNSFIELSFAFYTSVTPVIFRATRLNYSSLSRLTNVTEELHSYVSPVQVFFTEYAKMWANLRKALVN